ncbi:uncharacterized protein TNCT_331651 [Trichonephila clavata]|uniref:Gustatory receptor n=1 Tax=Trichonephila clavata TaxID=2740835 RepID=A0A8X6JY77_TRICU|nr:uncharacterized protein TNCT_331651 [Trichonephila clavata]
MDIAPEFRIILNSFLLTGTFFSNPKVKKQKSNLFVKATLITKLFVETLFILYAVYVVYSSIYLGPYASKTLRITSVTISAILLLLRLSFFAYKSKTLKTLSKLRAFGTMSFGHRKQIRTPLRKYAICACGLCIFFPISVAASSMAIISNKIDKYDFRMVTNHSSTASYALSTITLSVYQMMYMINFYMFPGLVMTVICFVYLSYVHTFLRHLETIRLRLLQRFFEVEMSRALEVLTMARKIHQDIEKSVSFVTFLAYVLIFGSILHLVCASVSNFLSDEKSMREAYSISIFSWTVTWFVVLTMCGSQVARNEVFIKNMRYEICDANPEGPQKLICLNFFDSCSGFKMRFTGWGMFEVNQQLLLTVSGVLITYGVLFASELQKTSSN